MNQDKLQEFDFVFNPKSIAVVGASNDKRAWGNRFLQAQLDANFKGALYPVNPGADKILGLDAYPSVTSIQSSVDYVIVAVPARVIPDVINDCVAKGVKVVSIFTAGFSESGQEQGRRLEEQIVKKARERGVRIIGPNCFGVCCPTNFISFSSQVGPAQSGSVAFLSQSGHYAHILAGIANERRIGISKSVSYGNECDLECADFLEYLAIDPETKIIGAYLEGTRNGRRLFQIIKEVSKTKPMVVLKGGRTQAGAEAARSHTGSLAGSNIVWTTALRQAGAIQVDNIDELTDTVLAFQQLSRFEGNSVAIVCGLIAGGGGVSVTSADSCTRFGLSVPPFTEETRSRLKALLPPVGGMLRNPVDMAQAAGDPSILNKTLELVFSDQKIELVMVHAPPSTGFISIKAFQAINDLFISTRKTQRKPLILVSGTYRADHLSSERKLLDAQIPVFPTFERAAKAIANMRQYSTWRADESRDASGV